MRRLYSSPLRVYLALAALAGIGIYSGFKLPVSLFPNSSKPTISVEIPFGSNTAQEFLTTYGEDLERQVRAISTDQVMVERTRASYRTGGLDLKVDFKWGTPAKPALKEVQTVVNAFAARFPYEIRSGIGVWTDSGNTGFLAVSFYSPTRSLDDLYKILEPQLTPQLITQPDARNPGLWNPEEKSVRIELNPEKMAALQLLPGDVERPVLGALSSWNGGTVSVGMQQMTIVMPRDARSIEDFAKILVPTPGGRSVHLTDLAKVDLGPKTEDNNVFKTSGQPSIILFSSPKPGGNVKRMSEDILEMVRQTMPKLPKDIQYRVLVDPSEFIRAAVNNVFHEVAIGAFLAVVVLFFFIGSFRNTLTAAIEIPLSMVLAFILMRLSGMNLNLISLGGLALSAGMNVDGSVVVIENIFRHFDEAPGPLSFQGKLEVIVAAVKEVRFAVIASTIASLVVFLPLAFTSDLSYAILGDLAKTVVFSHGFSALVALVLVPTVRLQLMSRSNEKPARSPIEPQIRVLEARYASMLQAFISSRRLKLGVGMGATVALIGLFVLVLPRLPREIIGKPDTDWMRLEVSTGINTLTQQMESEIGEFEAKVLKELGDKIQYTFTEIHAASFGEILLRMKDKRETREIWKKLEAMFPNSPTFYFSVSPWNPSELPIPDPPQMRLVVRGGTPARRAELAQRATDVIQSTQLFPRISTDPDISHAQSIVVRPYLDLWSGLRSQGILFQPSDLADLARVATQGRVIGLMPVDGHNTDVVMKYPDQFASSVEGLASLPLGVGAKLLPLKALAQVGVEESEPAVYREDGRPLAVVSGRVNEGDQSLAPERLKQIEELIGKWKVEKGVDQPSEDTPSIYFEDAEKDMHEALRQLGFAVALSVLLIFVTLVLQFQDFMNVLLVLVAVPLGFIGVLISLYVFRSSLSLNSVLGVILLNGISVANSIILVDFMKRLVDGGMLPLEAAVEAGRKRLRPILITSLTTILGMLPVAIGFGEGGRILQPLGIAVCGGLWVSMGLTLFLVPALQVAYLEWRRKRVWHHVPAPADYGAETISLQ